MNGMKDKIFATLIGVLVGALLTAGGYNITLARDVTANTTEIKHLQDDLKTYSNLASAVLELNRQILSKLDVAQRPSK